MSKLVSKNIFSNNLDKWSDTLSDYLSFNSLYDESNDFIFIIGMLHVMVEGLDSKGYNVSSLHKEVHRLWRELIEFKRENNIEDKNSLVTLSIFGVVTVSISKKFAGMSDFLRVRMKMFRRE